MRRGTAVVIVMMVLGTCAAVVIGFWLQILFIQWVAGCGS